MSSKLLIICGPTGVGKTQLAVSFARKLNGELVSADSRQVYREMDIGTGKDREIIGDVPVWMYDVVTPAEEFSVSQYVKLASAAIADIQSRGKLPIIVGGTGFYINALIHPFETINVPPDKKLRNTLEGASVAMLQSMLPRKVINSMNESDRQNPRRLIRKIETLKAATIPIKLRQFDTCIVGLTAPVELLEKRIKIRIDARLKQGMLKEVATVVKKYGNDIPALSAIGYRSPDTWAKDERAYAKRQMTYFRKLPGILWFDVAKKDYINEVTQRVLAWYTSRDT